jgi:TP901 family phage tail tape measure protein
LATVGSLAVVLTASATDFERTLGRAARAVKSTEKEFMRSARNMERIGRAWTIGVTAPILAGLSYVSKAAIDWEDAFAGVRKTVSATEEQFTELDQSLRKMTERIPMTHRELAGIAETAGQLGIQTQNIEDFTETMAMLGTATNMASDEAAIALAQMANVMQTSQQNFDRLGSVVVHLGNNLATMESDIVEFGQRIAGAGKIAGLTEAQVLAIGGAFASVGVNAEAGGTAVSKVLQSMTEAVATGNKNLQGFAAVSGMSAAEFATAWQEDAGTAFTRFIEGIGASGDQAFAIFRSLGLTDQRLLRGFLSVSGAGDLLRKSIEMGTQAWEENVALINEANERYKTAASRLKMLRNRAYNAAIALGGAFAPVLEAVMNQADKLIGVLQTLGEGFANLPAPVRTATGTLLLILAAIGPAYLAFAMLNKIIAISIGFIASIQSFASTAAFAFASWRLGAATLGESLVYLAGGPVKLVILAIGAAIVAAVLLAANWDKLRAFAVAAWNAISAAVMYAASLVVRGIGLIITAIGFIIPAVRGAGQSLIGLANSLKSSAGQAVSSAKSAAGAAKSAANAAKTAAQAAESQNAIADAGENAAKTQGDLAKGLDKARKAAQKSLAGFDEINQLQSSMGGVEPVDSSAPSAGGIGDISIPAIDVPEIPDMSGIGGIGDVAASVGDQVSKAVGVAASAWDRLKKAMGPVNKAVQWIKDNWPTIGPIIEGIASIIMVLLIPALIKSGIEALIAGGRHVLAWAMSGAAALVNGVKIVGQLLLVVARWAWAGIQAMINAGKIVLAWAMQGWAAVAQGAVMIGQLLLVVAKWAWAGVQSLAHAAKMAAAWVIAAGPVAWVAAIVIALAVLIIANWDWVKEKTAYIWGIVSKWLSEKWNWIKTTAGNIWDKIKTAVTSPIQNARTWLSNTWNSITTWLSGKWNGIWTTASSVWDRIKSAITSPIKTAREFVRDQIDKIKSFFNFKVSLPKIKLPHFYVSWSFGGYLGKAAEFLGLPGIPRFSVSWYKEGGVFNQPSIIGVGEAGTEVVMPLERNTGWIDVLATKLVAAMQNAQPAAAGAGGGGGDIYVYIGNEQIDAYIYRAQDRRNTRSNGR